MAHRARVVCGSAAVCVLVLAVGCAHGVTDEDWVDEGSQSLNGTGGTTTTSTTTTTTTSTWSTTTSTWSTTSSTTTGGSTCDLQGDCYACANCSTAYTCAPDADTCLNDTDCQALLTCFESCFDQLCADECANAHPTGAELYLGLTRCAFCDACPVDCALESQGLCYP